MRLESSTERSTERTSPSSFAEARTWRNTCPARPASPRTLRTSCIQSVAQKFNPSTSYSFHQFSFGLWASFSRWRVSIANIVMFVMRLLSLALRGGIRSQVCLVDFDVSFTVGRDGHNSSHEHASEEHRSQILKLIEAPLLLSSRGQDSIWVAFVLRSPRKWVRAPIVWTSKQVFNRNDAFLKSKG